MSMNYSRWNPFLSECNIGLIDLFEASAFLIKNTNAYREHIGRNWTNKGIDLCKTLINEVFEAILCAQKTGRNGLEVESHITTGFGIGMNLITRYCGVWHIDTLYVWVIML